MTRKVKILFLFFTGMVIACAFTAAFAYADHNDCVSECMDSHGCGLGQTYSGSDCSVYQYRCLSDCLDSGPSGDRKIYGAIAYSKKNGAYGFSDGRENQKKAEQAALKYCKENGAGCKVEVWFYNSCGAIATDGKKVVKWGQDDSEQVARQQALDKCSKGLFFKRKCEVKVSHCSR